MLQLNESQLESVVEVSESFKLDFDDAYQYTVVKTHDLEFISFDKDFDRTKRGRKTPADILKS